MKYTIWFDTEFYENGSTIDLISIGMVRHDGSTLYMEMADGWACSRVSDWVRENVVPHLQGGLAKVTRAEAAEEIAKFCGKDPSFWAYCGAYDWVVLNQLYGPMIDHPKSWPYHCNDVQQLAEELGLRRKLPEQKSQQHNALNDALWTKEAYDFCMERCGDRIS